MQIVQKSADGLSRVFEVVIPAQDLSEKLEARIAEIRPRLQIKGFRPGKVPASHVKKLYGKSLMGEIVEQALNETQSQALEQENIRPATLPDLKLGGDIEQVLNGQADLAYELAVEVMPEFEPVDVSTLELTRPVYQAAEAEVEAQLAEIALQNRTYEAKTGKSAKAADGDMVVVDFVGRIEGEVFEGGSGEDVEIVLGSGRFIPGFEDQLKDARAGAIVTVGVTFPEDYPVDRLRGKPAEFEVQVKEIRAPVQGEIDDAFAERIGLPSLEALRDAIRGQLSRQYQAASRFKLKRALLDQLDARHSFALPSRMVEAEFDSIWRQFEAERERGEVSDEDKAKSDEQLKAEYRKIAERRVRLGLVLAEIGRRNEVTVSDQELNAALMAEARQFPGQEQQVVQFYQQNPQAAAQLRAPIYEEKVVDLIIGRAKVEDKPVSKEALLADDDMPEGYGEGGSAETTPAADASSGDARKPKKASKPRAKKAAAADTSPEAPPEVGEG